ncbi:MAG: diphosphomevalonate decarboxylase [Candidatus Thermoplasmatota archaeon]|nr:diphosphomevalonate decarboxylase [Candidatus Thermoplasmatota archaeon]
MPGIERRQINGSETLAFPTIGIVLLGGISDSAKRYPLHNSAGIAYTSEDQDIYTRTRLFYSNEQSIIINGKRVDPDEPRTPLHILSKYTSKEEGLNGKLSVFSENKGIISGSSDAGAAALARAAQEMFFINDTRMLENDFRSISESVGRSLLGGLTVTELVDGVPLTTRLLGPEDFSNYVIVAFMFSANRNPSDTIHKNVVKSPNYNKRVSSTAEKCLTLRKLAAKKDIEGIFELAMGDTEEYHSLLESVEVKVITGQMRSLIQKLREERNDFWISYIVTGGTNVFVAAKKEDASKLQEIAKSLDIQSRRLKVAGAARVCVDF